MAKGTDKSIAPIELMRPHFDGPMLAAGDFTFESATAAVQSGELQFVAFGRAFLANPDLPERFRKSSPLNEVDFETLYSPGRKGYVDYPTLAEIASQ